MFYLSDPPTEALDRCFYRLARIVMEINSQKGEINEMRDQKSIVGYRIVRVKTVTVKRAERIMSAKKPSCRCHLHPSLKRLVYNTLVSLLLSFNSKGLCVNVYILWNNICTHVNSSGAKLHQPQHLSYLRWLS